MPTNFCLIADTHYYNVEALGLRTDHHQKTLNESGAILDAALDIFLQRKNCNVLIIAGDVTCDGERESHDELVKKLRRVQAAGKRVLLITSTHDFEQQSNARRIAQSQPIGVAYTVTGQYHPGMTRRDELRGIYDEFGFSDALSVYDELSYCAQIAPGLRVLMLNDDGNGRPPKNDTAQNALLGDNPQKDDSTNGKHFKDENGINLTKDGHLLCGYSPEQMEWILAQIAEAKAAGEAIFAVTHHPLLPPFPLFPAISKRDMLGDFETVRDTFSDNGLRMIFTGHSHIHNIGHYTSPTGNTITDINTAALCGYPAPMRFCSFADDMLDVHTETVNDFAWDLGGITAQDYLRDIFDRLLRDIIRSAAHDFDKFVEACADFGAPQEKLGRHKTAITILGKFLERGTLGTLGSILLYKRKIPKAAHKVVLGELIAEAVRNIYAGTEHYSPETPVGAAVQVLAERLQKLAGGRLRGTPAEDLPSFFGSLLYDDSPDWEWHGKI
ncbi:MAG: metallophosphoesterase [Oscillospiraceae bacterium]|jgi:3',5'-cyclic AMP phosphodiesterase CpdA|nr:metallophosphoesterase [Oscillospiraceae bacterium]